MPRSPSSRAGGPDCVRAGGSPPRQLLAVCTSFGGEFGQARPWQAHLPYQAPSISFRRASADDRDRPARSPTRRTNSVSVASPRADRLPSTVRRREGIEKGGVERHRGRALLECHDDASRQLERRSGAGRGHAGAGTLDVWNFSLAPRIAAVHRSRLSITAVRL